MAKAMMKKPAARVSRNVKKRPADQEDKYERRLERNRERRRKQRAEAFAQQPRVQALLSPVSQRLEVTRRALDAAVRRGNRHMCASSKPREGLRDALAENAKLRKQLATATALADPENAKLRKQLATATARADRLQNLLDAETTESRRLKRLLTCSERKEATQHAELGNTYRKLFDANKRWAWALANSSKEEQEELHAKGARAPRRCSDRHTPHGMQ